MNSAPSREQQIERAERPAPSRTGGRPRLTGALYIVYFFSAAPLALRGSLIKLSDPAGTVARIHASEGLDRLTLVSDFASYAVYIGLTILLAQLAARVSRTWATFAAVLSLTGCFLLVESTVRLTVPLTLNRPELQGVFPEAQRQQLSLLALRGYAEGYTASLFFFGAFCLILGALFFRGRLVPRALAGLLSVAGLAWVVLSVVGMIEPSATARLAPWVMPLGALAELALGLWLLLRGAGLESVADKARVD
jgi:hypothetical protein